MTYIECLKIRDKLLPMIGDSIIRDKIKYEIEEIIICPLLLIKVWLQSFNDIQDANKVNEHYMTHTDLEVQLYCLNLENENHIVLLLEENNS
jgi:hypothetical protein